MPRNNALVAVLIAIIVVQSVVMANMLWSPASKDARLTQVVGKPSKLEAVPGTSLKRVTLTPKAAERVGIATASVTEQRIVRSMVVAGEVTGPGGEDGVKQTVAIGAKGGNLAPSLVVQVPFSGDNARLDATKPVRIVRLGRQDAAMTAIPVMAPGQPSAGKALQYKIEAGVESLAAGERVRVEIPHVGSGAMRKTVPHSAVIYDATGVAWVYTTPEPTNLTYVRDRIEVDFVEGDLAVLKSGPATGTIVVSVGATLLWGTELGK